MIEYKTNVTASNKRESVQKKNVKQVHKKKTKRKIYRMSSLYLYVEKKKDKIYNNVNNNKKRRTK